MDLINYYTYILLRIVRIYHLFIGRSATPVTRAKIAGTELGRVEGIDVRITNETETAATRIDRRIESVSQTDSQMSQMSSSYVLIAFQCHISMFFALSSLIRFAIAFYFFLSRFLFALFFHLLLMPYSFC